MLRVIHIDDDRLDRRIIKRLLGSVLIDIKGVDTMEEALKQHAASPFDVALLDWHLPGAADPMASIAQLDALRPRPRIVIFTGDQRALEIAEADPRIWRAIDKGHTLTLLANTLIVAAEGV